MTFSDSMETAVEVSAYSPEQAEEWDSFVDGSRMPMFMFRRAYMDYHADRFTDASLMFRRKGELVAVLPASRHGEEIRSHGGLTYGGFIFGERMKQSLMLECFSVMRDCYGRQGVRTVLYKAIPHIYHALPAEEPLYALFRNGARVAKVEPSVTADLHHVLKVPKGRKAQIARARREGVVVAETDDLDTFIDKENEVLVEYHGARAVHTAAELRLLKERFPENIRCVGGFLAGRMVAGAVLFVYADVVHTQYLFADDTAREIGALDLVIAEEMSFFSKSRRWFDFGISTEENGRVLNAGLIAQKEGFGGRATVYVTYQLEL